MTIAIDGLQYEQPGPGLLSAERLRGIVSWVRPTPTAAVRDIQHSTWSAAPVIPEIDPVLELRLEEIEGLAPGWDDGAARAVDPQLLKLARDFLGLNLIKHTQVLPDLVPTLSGGLLFEWHTEALDLIIEMDPRVAPTFYFHNIEDGSEIEAALGEHMDAMESAFRKLVGLP